MMKKLFEYHTTHHHRSVIKCGTENNYFLNNVIIRQMGLQPYEHIFIAMHHFTEYRTDITVDEIWLVQHPKIFTQGKTGKVEHILCPGDIPVFQSDRGGQVTFHAPGQQIIYFLLDLKRRKIGVRYLITLLERAVISTLSKFKIYAHALTDAPGVYVSTEKICSIGLRIQKGCTLHGLALNVSMDLKPFLRINPCGKIGMKMTQVSDLSSGTKIDDIVPILLSECIAFLSPFFDDDNHII